MIPLAKEVVRKRSWKQPVEPHAPPYEMTWRRESRATPADPPAFVNQSNTADSDMSVLRPLEEGNRRCK